MILTSALGTQWMSLIGLIVILSIFACGVASMATATRLIFSMARDEMLPFSSHLKKVHKNFKVPRTAVWFVWAISVCCVIALRRLELITSISAVAGYIGYAGIIIAAFLSIRKEKEIKEGFSLSTFRKPIQISALIWTILVVAALTIPATEIADMGESHLPAESTLVALFLGAVIYFVQIRKKIKKGIAGPPGVPAS